MPMSIIVFIIRCFASLIFPVLIGMSLDPTISKNNSAWHANAAATAASLFLTVLYYWPLIAEAKSRKVVTRMPTSRSITGTRILTFGRWSWAWIASIVTVFYFFELQFICGTLSLIVVAGLVPPIDRLLFAPNDENTARLKSSSNLLKFFPNLGAFISLYALVFYTQKHYTVAIGMLLISIGLLLVVPIVLLTKGGWQALSLKRTLAPAAVPNQFIRTLAGKPGAIQKSHTSGTLPTRSTSTPAAASNNRIRRKYYNATAWHWNWPIPKELQRYPLNEEGFNLLIRGFEASWLESKDFHRRLALHRDPPTFLLEFIAEAEAYIQSIRLRPQLLVRNHVMSIGVEPVRSVPDEVSKVWQADKQLRSLYYATQRYAQTPTKQAIMPFRVIVPHIAEYRAMINLVKHLRHRLSRMSDQGLRKIPDVINKPMQTESITPIVFISYSWDSLEHENWVINLATKLRENGVDAILDKWDLGFLGNLLPHFMETSIAKSHRVICIMTPNYKKKTENLTGGVGYEYSIITAEIFADSINTSKFIPLFRRGTSEEAIPTALKGRKYVDMRDDTQFDEKFVHELLRDIHNEPRFKKPAIGKKTKF